MKKIIAYLIIVSILAGCEKPVTDIEIPATDPRLVVTCFITPGDTAYEAEITLSQPIYNTADAEPHVVEDADVFIKNNGNSVKLLFDTQRKIYHVSTTSLPVISGNAYQLYVADKAGHQVTASCRVPLTTVTPDTIEMYTRKDDPQTTLLRIQARWPDKPGEKNYYRLFIESFLPAGPGMDSNYFEVGSVMLSDESADGKRLTSWLETYPETILGSSTWFDVYLLHTDEHYFKYHEGRLSYEGDNPFAEPNIIPSNIEGGLGCFGAYTKVVKRVKWTF